MRLTDEQREVVDAVRAGHSVVCISKPGTGKTTTAIEAARAVSGRTLLLTYNRKLKEETRLRVRSLDLESTIEVHSYHAAACALFALPTSSSVDDALIHAAVEHAPESPLDFALVVVDEAQDMTPLYAKFVRHVLSHCAQPPLMMLIGDPFQSIFRYLGATWEYMMTPATHFASLVRGAFVERHLSLCWRITPEMAAWVNTHLHPRHLALTVAPEWWATHGPQLLELWGEGIRAGKPSKPGSVAVMAMDTTPHVLTHAVHSYVSPIFSRSPRVRRLILRGSASDSALGSLARLRGPT